MKYDFDRIHPRRGTYSLKWDLSEDPSTLPMWVADMDFKTAPAVTEALIKRAAQGIFGYVKTPSAYYEAVINWFSRRHGLAVRPEWILTATGVVPALSAVIKALAEPGDKIILQTPVYNCFFSCIRNNGCEVSSSPLIYENNAYRMDFEDLEKKASDPKAKLFLLCNPHNPAGRVWTREELLRAGEICARHGVLVVADEIHCELTAPGVKYTPFASLSSEFLAGSVTCSSPSKAFNLAGLQAANIFASEEPVRQKIDRALNINETCGIGVFGAEGVIAAYDRGEDWLEELNAYIHANFLFLKEFFARELPRLPVTPLEGTYLVWINCAALGLTSAQLANKLRTEGKLLVNPGHLYGPEGNGFIRLNIACPRELLADGLNRFLQTVKRL